MHLLRNLVPRGMIRLCRVLPIAAVVLAIGLGAYPLLCQVSGSTFLNSGNPILSDGSMYSADPAPLVVGNTMYILAGRDEAPPGVNDFIMNEWQLFATDDVGSHRWTHFPAVLRPESTFAWAAAGHAYAGQIVRGADRHFYLYAPVQEAHSANQDPFAIGVAVADTPLGPWKDAHPSGPIVSQSVPVPNRIQNIDPTVMVDEDGRVYLYWGTFGQLRGIELESDMVTPKGPEVAVRGLPGFFEAPWLFKRHGTYYMVYAGNQAGPNSPCTPAVYHACIEYGTAPSPMGPWTFRGVVLDPVSSTTSHPGIAEFKGKWYLIYHTADAKGGGHFRRSVAIDEVLWDDSVQPAAMRKVRPTHAPGPRSLSSRNVAPAALPTASNQPVPVQYWIKALNDGVVRENPLPPDMWASWTPQNPAQQWIEYTWSKPLLLNGARLRFWADHPANANEGVAPPAAWHMEYRQAGKWIAVRGAAPYPTSVDHFVEVAFQPVTTRCLRAVFDASGSGAHHAAVAVQEWEVLTPSAVLPEALPPAPAEASCDSQ